MFGLRLVEGLGSVRVPIFNIKCPVKFTGDVIVIQLNLCSEHYGTQQYVQYTIRSRSPRRATYLYAHMCMK